MFVFLYHLKINLVVSILLFTYYIFGTVQNNNCHWACALVWMGEIGIMHHRARWAMHAMDLVNGKSIVVVCPGNGVGGGKWSVGG